MKPTIAIWILITAAILAVTSVYIVGTVANNTAVWTGVNASDFEEGFIQVMIPFSILGFALALIIGMYKGRPNRFRTGGGPPEDQ